ncbi:MULTISPECIES: C39 family peptidase [Pseudomonas]|uniref:Peptidase C39, bacteriocin processing n=1 Tax=Pseudomonas chlororaphis TaxID=587753 RepID=A0AAX3FMH0_9PSED|nr:MULTISPECIES: C39 family peptidase [Pseudomonas]AVO59063.1 peptidase C39 [Pseudomonas chlororaphis subsp. piscium]AZC37428.1 Bacteriocin resistance protein [Pseudomonas chlororaphis subsp. piscium]AZC43977.1 Bacteriocin resistance protein [Pseudomonas chlororaphis subsp. piscium]AZC50631.1 Bacteriocin resistance protein [Pseudomonas chlororaphis subsp. piscium]AZC57209.1 Bacteriocin resistance protein [Pseudomonas chlororaphis subsp. piscium]
MRVAALSFLLCLAGLTQAAQMPVAVLPGGNLVYKQVQSVRERKFADLVEQKTDFSCGAAALATILRQAYWLDVDEEHVIKGMLATADQDLVRTQGFSMLDMKRYLESIGMRARGYRIPPDKLQAVSIPVVVLMDIRGYKHFVVMQRAHKDWVYIGDPVLGHKRYSHEDFVKGWNGIVFAIVGPGYDKANALLDPPNPLTAKNKLDTFNPVKDAELMEFGFIQSDFF